MRYARNVSDEPGARSVDLRATVARGRAAWPALTVGDEAFAAHLTGLHADPPEGGWERLHAGDLYLACACAEGDPAALAAFDHEVWPAIDAALARARLTPDRRQDLMQDLRVLLFVSQGNGPAKIAQYRGQAELRLWLRAVALRDAYRIARKARRELALDDAALAAVAVIDRDPGLAHLKHSCRVELKSAFESALAALPRADRLLLRQYHLDRLTVDELAALHKIHRATAARRVAKIRSDLTDAILAQFGRRLHVADSELDSLIRLVRSQIDISFDRLLVVG
ncbi:MAG TPA: hypothetical protein VK698_11705 [Kofleriaceae bacterium]|nr:hypothetical protein [Kofleriaceae bacterium]